MDLKELLRPTDPRHRVVYDVMAEIERQDEKWGEQNPPDFALLPPFERAVYHGIPDEATAKRLCEDRARNNTHTWADILVEEIAEAVGCIDRYSLREELVQVAAVVHQWIAAIDRREALQAQAWDTPSESYIGEAL